MPSAAAEAIEARHPGTASKTAAAPAGRARTARDGELAWLEARAPQGWRSLHSRHDPAGEAGRALEGSGVEASRAVFVLGLGSGHLLEEVLRRAPADAHIVVVEPEASVFREASALRDLAPALTDRRVSFFLGETPAAVCRGLDLLTWGLSFRNPRIVEQPSYAALYPEYMAGMRRGLLELFEIEKSGVATRFAGQKAFARNILRNLPRLARAASAAELFGLFRGRPAVIVSAGPSLGKQLPLLKELQGRAVIICVDTALRAALQGGVRPDLTAAVDFTPVNYRHFDGVDTSGLAIAAAATVYPKCLEAHDGPLFSIFNEYPLVEWLMPLLGSRGQVTIGDSTAHTAFHLAERMGCSPIILIGQDLAHTGGKTHAEGVATRKDAGGSEGLQADGWYGGKVPTTSPLMTMLKHFEAKIAQCRAPVVNATEGGARIDGAAHLSFAEAARVYCGEPFEAGPAIAAAAAARPGLDLAAFAEHARFARRRAARARARAHAGIRVLRRIVDALCCHDVAALKREVAALDAVYDSILSDGDLLHLLQGGLELSLMQLRWPEPDSGAPLKHDILVEVVKDRRFLNDLCAAAADFSREIRRCGRALRDAPGSAGGQTDDWLRRASRAIALGGER